MNIAGLRVYARGKHWQHDGTRWQPYQRPATQQPRQQKRRRPHQQDAD